MQTGQDLDSLVIPLREQFLSMHADGLPTYDERDFQLVKDDDVFVKCFLRAFYGKDVIMENAVKSIDSVLKFRKEYEVNDLKIGSFSQELVDKNVMFFEGVTKNGKIIFHYKVGRFFRGTDGVEMKRYISFILEQHFREHMSDSIVVLFDFTGAGISNMDLNVVRFIIDALSSHFPALLDHILVFEMPWIVSAIWRVIRGWLSEGQRNLITQVSTKDIQEHIDSSQLEQHMIKA